MRRYSFLFTVLLALLAACSQYDTDVVGESFVPYNGIVGTFTHLVYVEFHDDDVRVWGPAAHEVEVEKTGARLTLTCSRDSMAYFCFGSSVNDSLRQGDGQLHIVSEQSYALYLNGLRLTSLSGPAIWSETEETTYLVVSGSSASVLQDRRQPSEEGSNAWGIAADACLMTHGPLVLDGKGVLRVYGEAPLYQDGGEHVFPHAIHAIGGLRCAYPITTDIRSLYGDAIHVDADDVAIADGTWGLHAGRHAIANEEGGVSLTGGKVYGSSVDAFIVTPEEFGLSVAESSCIAFSGAASSLDLTSSQTLWQQQLDTLSLMADTTYTISRKDTTSSAKFVSVGNLTPRVALVKPWLLLSTSAVTSIDSVRVVKK